MYLTANKLVLVGENVGRHKQQQHIGGVFKLTTSKSPVVLMKLLSPSTWINAILWIKEAPAKKQKCMTVWQISQDCGIMTVVKAAKEIITYREAAVFEYIFSDLLLATKVSSIFSIVFLKIAKLTMKSSHEISIVERMKGDISEIDKDFKFF